MTVLVTGGKGFIGRRLVEALEKKGNEVRVIDVEKENMLGVLDFDSLLQAMQGVKIVFHLGAISGNLYFEHPPLGIKVNCLGTWNLLEAARIARVKRVVFASTSSLYAETPIPHKETSAPEGAVNLYSATKLFGEYMMQMYWQRHRLETVICRFASIYGVGEESKGHVANPVTQFICDMLEGNQPVLFGDGSQTRDLTYVDDVVSALLHCATSFMTVMPGEIYNVSTNYASSFNYVVEVINKVLGTDIKPKYEPYKVTGLQSVYVDSQVCDNTKLVSTGWTPKVSLEEGIRRIVESKKKPVTT